MTTGTFFETVNSGRKAWQPITPTAPETVVEGAQDTLSKCFALSILELPVRDFIYDGMSRTESSIIGEDGKNCLLRNVKDEEKHDQALANCKKVYTNYNPKFESEALNILKAWQSLKDHPFMVTACIENGLFFVILPLYRKHGGPSIRTTALDISADEVKHVQAHRHAAELLGQRPSKTLDNLRKATIDWLVNDLTVENPDIYRRSSDSLMYKGVAPELSFTKTYTVNAFFETRNDTLGYYTSKD